MLQLLECGIHFSEMENICVLTDFPGSSSPQYYKQIATPVAGRYTVYTGGNFVYVSNTRNRTVRFSSKEDYQSTVSEMQINGWLERIRSLFPQF